MIMNKILVTVFFAIVLCLSYSSQQVLAQNSPQAGTVKQPEQNEYKVKPQLNIASLEVNGKYNQDMDVFINSDGSLNLPFKRFATLLNIKIKQNHLTKEISFTLKSF